MTTEDMQGTQQNDAALVADSLDGKREAFRQIVERYQTLICSLGYCATGSVSQSEDLAQETFVVAWKQLAELREPSKLRFLIGKQLRSQGREPVYAAESLEAANQFVAPELPPSNQAISNEEKAILWRALERIPETYREPLVLFYREHQSIERVAEALELSEDAVKQRLSRGRKLLQEEFLAFVEGALARTNPGNAFTLGVLAVLPGMTLSAKAATLGAAAKGGAAIKGAGLIGLLGAVLTPLLAIFAGWKNYRLERAAARSDDERKFYKSYYQRLSLCGGGFILAGFILMGFGKVLMETNPWLFAALMTGAILGYPLVLGTFFRWRNRARKAFPPQLESATGTKIGGWEYRSRFELLGLPFIHIQFGGWPSQAAQSRKPLKAWIAISDATAIGVLFAYGGCAIAPVSIGAVAIGFVSYGAMATGVLAFGGFGLGIWSCAGFAFGWQAVGCGSAIAWNTACAGAYAVARDYAFGDMAHALHANDETVRDLVLSTRFYRFSYAVLQHFFWLVWVWALPLLISMIVQWRTMSHARRLNKTADGINHGFH